MIYTNSSEDDRYLKLSFFKRGSLQFIAVDIMVAGLHTSRDFPVSDSLWLRSCMGYKEPTKTLPHVYKASTFNHLRHLPTLVIL